LAPQDFGVAMYGGTSGTRIFSPFMPAQSLNGRFEVVWRAA